jgi:hypothetical protein
LIRLPGLADFNRNEADPLTNFRTLLLVIGLMLSETALVYQAADNPGITATLSPAHPTVGVTNVSIKGTASPGAAVSDTSTYPDGTVKTFSFKADSTGKYEDGPFVLQQLGTFHDVLQDRATGASTSISYMGAGDFTLAVDPANRTVAKGETATYTVIFTSVAGFLGTVAPAEPKGLHIPGATAWWSQPLVSVPAKSSGVATLIIRTSAQTPAGTYRNIILRATNGSVIHAASPRISLTVH